MLHEPDTGMLQASPCYKDVSILDNEYFLMQPRGQVIDHRTSNSESKEAVQSNIKTTSWLSLISTYFLWPSMMMAAKETRHENQCGAEPIGYS